MKVKDLQNKLKKKVVVFGGRFQPFHQRHFEAYQNLSKYFFDSDVFIASSNKIDLEKSPFSFDEKKKIITSMYDIPESSILNVRVPYNPIELLSNYDEEKDVLIQALGIKDAERLKGKYYIGEYKDHKNNLKSFDESGYLYIVPSTETDINASDVRKYFRTHSVDENKQYFKNLYGKFNEEIFELFISKLH